MITETAPADWRALQDEVAAILTECGFTVDKERTFATVRGSVELDVYGCEEIDGRSYSIACECKHWASRIPQTHVHAFRSVLADLGVNSGYIVSSNGFQSGAFEASQNTNVKLLTWPEFQAEFSQAWLKKHLSPTLRKDIYPIVSYTEPLMPDWFIQVPKHEVQVLRGLRETYGPFGWLITLFITSSSFICTHDFPDLPLRPQMAEQAGIIPDSILDAVGYREFMDNAIAFGKKAIAEFREVKQRNDV